MMDLLPWIQLLIGLGADVIRAALDGDGSKTVDQILAGRKLDMDKIRELDADARDHFNA